MHAVDARAQNSFFSVISFQAKEHLHHQAKTNIMAIGTGFKSGLGQGLEHTYGLRDTNQIESRFLCFAHGRYPVP